MTYDIHQSAKRLKLSAELVRSDNKILDENKLLILKFIDFCEGQGLAAATIIKDTIALKHASNFLDKPFEKATVDDMVKVCKKIQERDWSEATKRTSRITLKKFYKWLRKTDYYPDEVRWIKTSRKSTETKIPDILTEEEVLKLVEVADNPRDKALVMSLYESGCRIGELLSMKIKNMSFNDQGATINVSGKTGSRRILLISSAPLLASWLDAHPLRNDPDAFLWVTKFNRLSKSQFSPMGLAAAGKILDVLRLRAGIKKRVYPHLFRHTRATHLANKLTEAQMKQLFGWTPESGMAAVYVHLSGRDIDNALLELNGLANQTKTEPKVRLKICPRCNERNSPDSKYCKRCALVIDAETMEWENEQMNELIKQPRVANYLRRMMAQPRK